MTVISYFRRIGAPVASAISTGARVIRRISAPIVSAVVTAAVIGGALWIQDSRGAWPFEPASAPVATLQGTVPAATTGSDPNHNRVPVDVTQDTVQALGIRLETVGRQSLTQEFRAVATVVPDDCIGESRGSAGDPCPESCARCVCCARAPIFVPQVVVSPAADVQIGALPLPAIGAPRSAFPHRILHVPKAL